MPALGRLLAPCLSSLLSPPRHCPMAPALLSCTPTPASSAPAPGAQTPPSPGLFVPGLAVTCGLPSVPAPPQEHRGCCLPLVTSSRPFLGPFLLPASLAAPGEVLALRPGQPRGAFCLVFQSPSSRACRAPSAAAGHGGSAPAPCPWLSPCPDPHGPQPLLSPCAVPPGPHVDSSCRRDIIRNVNY